MFEQQMPVLADTYQVLAWDMRGHGRSQPAGDAFTIDLLVADLLAVLEDAGTTPAIMVDRLAGRHCRQELAFRQPERVAEADGLGLFVHHPAAGPAAGAPATRGARPATAAGGCYPTGHATAPLGQADGRAWPAVRAQAVALASRIPRALFLQILAALATSACRARLSLHRGLLIAYGERDRYGSPRRAAHLGRARPRSPGRSRSRRRPQRQPG
ncbi:MAG: hypothetical protein U0Z44_10390 [Kouleothrix sp.]